MKAIIVGGGIGGLATALMLHARGIACEVYEQADAVRELGVGINTLPHAIAELKRLGLLERLHAPPPPPPQLLFPHTPPPGSSTPTASARRSGASRAGSMPATRCRSSRSIAGACRA